MPETTTADVTVYTSGLCYLSACAALNVSVEEVERSVNGSHPTGLDHGWEKSPENFKGGEDNPCPCNSDSTRQHWLFVC